MTPTLLRAEYEAGATVRDLRRRLGAGADRVLRLLAEAETPMRRRGPRPTLAADIRRAEARALRMRRSIGPSGGGMRRLDFNNNNKRHYI